MQNEIIRLRRGDDSNARNLNLHLTVLEHPFLDLGIEMKEINEVKILKFLIEFPDNMSLMLWLWMNQLKKRSNWKGTRKNKNSFHKKI